MELIWTASGSNSFLCLWVLLWVVRFIFPSQFFSDSWIHDNFVSRCTCTEYKSSPYQWPQLQCPKTPCLPPLPCPLPFPLPPPSRYTACILSPPWIHCVDFRVPVNTVSVFFAAYSHFLWLTCHYWAQMIIDITPRGSHHCHEPGYWSMMDQYKVTLLQGKQAKDVSLWFPYRLRAGRSMGNSHGHSLSSSTRVWERVQPSMGKLYHNWTIRWSNYSGKVVRLSRELISTLRNHVTSLIIFLFFTFSHESFWL